MKYFLEIENVTGKKMSCVCKQNKANYRIGHAFRHLSILYLLLSIVANLEKFQKISRIKNTLHNIVSCPPKSNFEKSGILIWIFFLISGLLILMWKLKYLTHFPWNWCFEVFVSESWFLNRDGRIYVRLCTRKSNVPFEDIFGNEPFQWLHHHWNFKIYNLVKGHKMS